MRQERELTDRTKGMFAGQATDIGQYDDLNLIQNSGAQPITVPQNVAVLGGATRGEPSAAGYEYNLWPAIVGGLTDYDPKTTQPGGNIHSVQFGAIAKAKKAGFDAAVPTGASVSGMAAY